MSTPFLQSFREELQLIDRELTKHPREHRLSRASINRILEETKARSSMTLSLTALTERIRPSPMERLKLRAIKDLTENPRFEKHIKQGVITFGIIKPHSNEAKLTHLSDTTVASRVMKSVKRPLRILAHQDMWMPSGTTEAFYANLTREAGEKVFERVVDAISGGAITGLILESDTENAVAEWREQIGPTDPRYPDGEGRKDRIRHRFASSITNNVIHGSDSIETVKREIDCFRDLICKTLG